MTWVNAQIDSGQFGYFLKHIASENLKHEKTKLFFWKRDFSSKSKLRSLVWHIQIIFLDAVLLKFVWGGFSFLGFKSYFYNQRKQMVMKDETIDYVF